MGDKVGCFLGNLAEQHAQTTAGAADTSTYMQPATDTLSTLVAPLFLRPLSNTGAAPAEAGPQRASERLPLLRAPSVRRNPASSG